MGCSDIHQREPYFPLRSVILVSKLAQNIRSRRESKNEVFFTIRALV